MSLGALVAANCLVHLGWRTLPARVMERYCTARAAAPSSALRAALAGALSTVSHARPAHLAANLAPLCYFGGAAAAATGELAGHIGPAYAAGGACGVLAHLAAAPPAATSTRASSRISSPATSGSSTQGEEPPHGLRGASGAVCGVVAGLALLAPAGATAPLAPGVAIPLQWPAGLWLANALNPRDLGRPPDVISLPCHVGGAAGGVAYACGVSLLGAPL